MSSSEPASSLEDRIRHVLAEHNVPFEAFEHPPVYTNPTMADALGVKPADTIKNICMVTKEGEAILVLVPGDARIDSKKIAAAAGTSRVSFADEKTVLEKVGCPIGCVPPFDHAQPLRVFMDRALLRKQFLYFNPGVHVKSFKIPAFHLRKLTNAGLV
ncbi:MAG: YbaK/EbsC family protein [Planctomycetota bacterium]